VIGTLSGRETRNAPFLQTNRERQKWLKAKNGRVSTSAMEQSIRAKMQRMPASKRAKLSVAFICVVVVFRNVNTKRKRRTSTASHALLVAANKPSDEYDERHELVRRGVAHGFLPNQIFDIIMHRQVLSEHRPNASLEQ
jgi:hypothetical protein